MKEIVLKRKTLIIIIISISALSVIGLSQEQTIKKAYFQTIPLELRQVISPHSQATIYDEARRLHEVVTEKDFYLYQLVWYGSGSFHSGASIQYHDGVKIYESFKTYQEEYHIARDLPEYYLDVILSQWFSGNVEKTQELLAKLDPNDLSQPYKDQYHLINASVALSLYDIDLVKTSLASLESHAFDPIAQNFEAYMYYAFGLGEKTSVYDISFSFYEDNQYFGYLSTLESYCHAMTEKASGSLGNANSKLSDHRIAGTAMMNGKPLKGGFAYLDTHRGSYGHEGFDGIFMPINDDGTYAFENIPYATNHVGFILPIQLNSDKIVSFPEQRWNNDFDRFLQNDLPINFVIEDAPIISHAYLEGDTLIVKVTEPKGIYYGPYRLTVNLNDPEYTNSRATGDLTLDENGMGSLDLSLLRAESEATYNFVWNNKTPSLMDLTEPLYLSDTYLLSVKRKYDENMTSYYGNFTNNRLTYPLWIPGEEDYNDGDRLITEEKFDQAIAYYEANPSLHNLKTLFALYHQGYTLSDQEKSIDNENIDHQKAADTMVRIIDTYGESYSRLSSLYYEYAVLNDYEKQRETLERWKNYSNDAYVDILLAKVDAKEVSITKAIEKIDALDLRPNDYSRVQYLYLLANETRNIEPNILEAYVKIDKRTMKPFFTLTKHAKPQELYDYLDGQVENDLVLMYKLLLLDEFMGQIETKDYPNSEDPSSFSDYYREKLKKMDSVLIKNFLIQLKEDHNWFD